MIGWVGDGLEVYGWWLEAYQMRLGAANVIAGAEVHDQGVLHQE